MAWTFLGHRGSATSKGAFIGSLSVNPTATIPVGAILVVRVSTDNFQGEAGIDPTHFSVTDSKGNVYTKIQEFTRSPGGANQDGVTGSLWAGEIATALTTADTVTINFLFIASWTSVIALEEFSVASGNTFAVVGSTSTRGTGTTPSATLSGLAAGFSYLFLGHIAIEGPNGDAFTQDADYLNNTSVGTTGGAALSNVASRFGRRIATLTTDTYNPTLGTSRDWVENYAALREVIRVAQTALQPWEGLKRLARVMEEPLESLGYVAGRGISELGSDDFNRADSNVLGRLWVESESAADIISISGNKVRLNSPVTGGGFAIWDAVGFASAQFAEMKTPNTAWTGSGSVAVRIQPGSTPTAFNGYLLFLFSISFPNIYVIELLLAENADLTDPATLGITTLGSGGFTDGVAGMKVRLEAYPGYFAVIANGIEKFRVADSTHAGGKPGVYVWAGAALADLYDDWNGGNLEAPQFWEALVSTGAISQTAQVPWDARGYLAVLRAAPWEALAAATRQASVPWEALQVLTATRQAVWESLAGLTQAVAVPWTILGFLARLATVPWESVLAISRDGDGMIEALATAMTQQQIPWESLAGRSRVAVVPWEALQAISAQAAPVWTALAAQAATASVSWEALSGFVVVTQDALIAWEAKGSVARVTIVPVEAGAAISRAAGLSWEALAAQAATVMAIFEVLAGRVASNQVPVESLGFLAALRAVAWESLRTLTQSGVLDLEALRTITRSSPVLWEAIGQVLRLALVNYEAVGAGPRGATAIFRPFPHEPGIPSAPGRVMRPAPREITTPGADRIIKPQP